MTDVKKQGAPFKEIKAESFLHLRCLRSDKAKWVLAAQGNGGLSAWVTKILNENSQNNE